ncbi:putative leucine-rich repeat receptor-like serine/threonine-protein kinase [Heracleum sosnowskyi]|uniref:Leucine-rich repeat receptor-like serine/threonine-protein kinase n=1 Tax=Heracleum sosnowskyi TaxID=360622 RepID=A0AAD8H1M2_9APIA|nr:putative leucine-rich repeat receptor-like serine/threonine-protein kinase [Heracleum sosnowskyi]
MNMRKAIIRPFKSGTINFKRNMYLLLLQYLILATWGKVSGDHYHRHHTLESDREALMEFKKTISADPNSTLANWNEMVDVCNFTGVVCNRTDHRVQKLVLAETKLVGLFSPFLFNLTRLQVIRLNGNNLHGSLPDCFSSFTELFVLLLAQNNLMGNIPPSLFSNCTSLTNIDLSHNLLTGTIPADIGNCPHLWTLNLYNNQFTGEIPSSLTNLSAMCNLDLEYNHLSGELPGQLMAQLPGLTFLHLSNNKMISHDRNTNLDPFFTLLANCTRLKELELGGMDLGGTLPSSIGRLSSTVKNVLLHENQIFGSIPPAVGNLWNLSLLNLTSNILNGTISPEIGRLKNLEQLVLSYNYFTGEIPAALGQLRQLGLLDLSSNQFSGLIPQNLGNLVQLKELYLNNNYLSGEIPPSLWQCKDLDKLDLSYNKLTGKIPTKISAMSEMGIYLNLSHNHLQGPLPIELSTLAKIQEIDLSSNNLSGPIFTQISSCIAVMMMNFSKNSLDGQLPDSLDNLKNLQAFDVSNNSLFGAIPTSLSKLQNLTFLNLSYNHFTGKLPSGGFFDTAKNLSFLVGGNTPVIENMGDSTANLLSGTIGYIAPEYGFGSGTSIKGDVYSFGVLVLEMVTRKRPTDDMFTGGLSLHKWVKSHYQGRMEKIINSNMVRAIRNQSPEVKRMWEVAIGELIELGILCSQYSPSTRPTMLDVADDLDRLKRYLGGETTATFASSLGMSSSTVGDD